MGKFVITIRKNGEYQFNLKAANGQNILASEGYKSKAGCLAGIESVQKNASEDRRFEKLTAANGKHYFNLKAANGQIIGTSQMYESIGALNNGVDSVKANAPAATVDDQID